MESPREQREHYRSHLVEQFCPYIGKKVLGFMTYRYVPNGAGPYVEQFTREIVRADCLEAEQCPDLSCQKGMNPFR